jgi:hypothetical protein
MRKVVLVATIALVCQAAYAKDTNNPQVAQAVQTDPPAAQPAPAAPAQAGPAQAATAPQAAPTAAAPDAAPPTDKTAKPAKKRVARRHRNWEADEAKARSIAAKYGVSW